MIYFPCEAILFTHADAGNRSRTRDEQEITQGVNKKKGNLIENWLSTVSLSFENLVDPLLERPSENMSSDSEFSRSADIPSREAASAPGTGFTNLANGVRAPRFRDLLVKRNIFVNDTEASTELMKRVKEIITNKEPSSEMDDALAKKLADQEWNLETSQETELISNLVLPLIPDTTQAPYQNLQRHQNKKWSISVTVRVDPSARVDLPRLPRPKPDIVFGYSKIAFNTSQVKVSRLLETKSGENYGMPDGKSMFPFLVLECKAQATGGTHFVATNQAATAGAFAMNGTLELALRISPEGNIDYDEPMFFSITIDHLMACINVHWLSKEAESGEYYFHMKRILRYFLDVGGLKAISRAIKNILHYGANERLTKIRGQLDMYAQKVKETAPLDKGDSAPNLPSEELPNQTHSLKRKTGKPTLQSKRRRSAKGGAGNRVEDGEAGEDGEDGEEGSISSAARRLKISREKKTPKSLLKKATANAQAKKHGQTKQPEEPSSSANTVRKSTRLLDRHANQVHWVV